MKIECAISSVTCSPPFTQPPSIGTRDQVILNTVLYLFNINFFLFDFKVDMFDDCRIAVGMLFPVLVRHILDMTTCSQTICAVISCLVPSSSPIFTFDSSKLDSFSFCHRSVLVRVNIRKFRPSPTHNFQSRIIYDSYVSIMNRQCPVITSILPHAGSFRK